jgi:hypothetical protein
VTSAVTTKTKRKDERIATAIQYVKIRIKRGDFEVDHSNYRGWANYQGGHLIDHKFSAENSHYEEKNYIPEHYFYNAPLKEHLVQRSDSYLEFPLYTPKPPTIGVKGKTDRSHPIPIGVIFIQINDNKIRDLYFFPNNNFDYKGLCDRLNLKKGDKKAETLAPYFKLKKSFHPLLLPAIITDSNIQDGESRQAKVEEKFFKLLDTVSTGMSLAECSKEHEDISQLSFSVLHEKEVKPEIFLVCDQDKLKDLKDQPLLQPLKALGVFLVRYALKNALKSEVLSVKSRLVFLNVLIDFIEGENQVGDEAMGFADSLTPQFISTLKELVKLEQTMNLEELLYLANTYKRLSSPFIHDFSIMNYELAEVIQLDENVKSCVQVLQLLTTKFPIDSLDKETGWSFIECTLEVDETIDYLIETGFPKEEFKMERKFLRSIQKFCVDLFCKIQPPRGIVNVQIPTSINGVTNLKTSFEYINARLEKIGV